MRILLRTEQNEVYKELVEVLKHASALEDREFLDAFRSIEHIAAIVGGAEMLNKFGGDYDFNQQGRRSGNDQRDSRADAVSIQHIGREVVSDKDARRDSNL